MRAGELVALYGPSGSGKLTLLMLVAALLAPDSGAVLLDGREVSALSEAQAAHYRLHDVGLISQQAELLPGARVIENAALKLRRPMPAARRRACARCLSASVSASVCATAASSSRSASASG